MSLSGFSLAYVDMGRADTKHGTENSFAESMQIHCVLQDLIYYSCLEIVGVSVSSLAILHFHSCCGCFINMSEVIATLLGDFQIGNRGTER